jgi:putative drug exporter of the RND superfamily
MAIVGTLLGSATTNAQSFTQTQESDRATALIVEKIGAQDPTVENVLLTSRTPNDPALRTVGESLAKKISALGPEIITSVGTPWSGGGDQLIAKSGTTVLIPVTMSGDVNDARKNAEDLLKVTRAASVKDGVQVRVAGLGSIDVDTNAVAENDLKTGEGIGILIGLVILAFVFGALVSALLPVGLAIASIIVALALTALIGQIGQLSFFVTNMITMMGLAVGIDYVLFIVSRFREERAAGVEKIAAISRAADTAGRAVIFSGLTVVVALIGMVIVPSSIFLSLGIGAILVVLAAVAASTTLLPAVLSLLGDKIEKGSLSRLLPKQRADRPSFWVRIVDAVMRRPVASLLVTAAILAAASIPYFSSSTGASGISTLSKDLESRQAYDILGSEFKVAGISPAVIPIVGDPNSPANKATIAEITSKISGDPILGTPALAAGATSRGGVLTVPVNAESSSNPAADAVRRLRAVTALPVGGLVAQNVDFFDISSKYLPIVITVVLALSFLILLLAFRSIVVPFLAIALNLLSVGAAFGILTLVTQKGYGAGFFGFQKTPVMEAWLPLFLFSVLFGLSMDYHVFLLSRIRERFDRTGDNTDSIRFGIGSSARLITGAALIMVAVFGGFAAGDLVMFQQMGFGLGVAVLIDATIVRSILVPAAMKLIGEHNWYLPKALGWLPRLSIEGPAKARTAAE